MLQPLSLTAIPIGPEMTIRIKLNQPKTKIRIKRSPSWWSLHSHSKYSANDALPEVEAMVIVSAGMLMTSLQTAFHTLVPESNSPLNVLERINRLYIHNIKFTTFVTIFFAKFDPKTRLFTYANAGHNSGYLYRASKKQDMWLHPTGPAIGLMEGFILSTEEI